MAEPYAYYANNVTGTLNLLQAMHRHGVDKLVFSSTAAIFGTPVSETIDEDHPKAPINPYGASKLMVERILEDAACAYGLRSVSLRYFNAAGASPDGDIGECHEPETHLIPNVLRAALGQGTGLKVFGNDYPTPDGTCIRDYVHVSDLAGAHVAALEWLVDHPDQNLVANCGYGLGLSVLEVLDAIDRANGRPIDRVMGERRAGDPPALVAANARLLATLDWSPAYASIDAIVGDALAWERKLAVDA
jgi:UDP-glucose 4-epimerase